MANLTISNEDVGGIVIGNPIYETALLTFAGADDLVAGTILGVITSTGKYGIYDSGNSDGTEIPKAVLTIATSAAGAGDVPIRPLISGEVRQEKLVIDDGSTVTKIVEDQLRDYGIIPINVTEKNIQDNQ